MLRGDYAEEVVSTFNGKELLNMTVEVGLCQNEAMLCVAHLPMNIDDKEFNAMVEPYGAIERCFLMRNKHTGIFIYLSKTFLKLRPYHLNCCLYVDFIACMFVICLFR